jgi:predicted NBD/HSP70 family sugar kinase
MIRDESGLTRAELMLRTGLSRSTMGQRLEQLAAHELIVGARSDPAGRGRPPAALAFNPAAGTVLSGGIGATHCRLGLLNLGGELLAERASDVDIGQPPDTVIDWLVEQFTGLVKDAGRDIDDVRAVGLGVPAPVEHATGTPVNPPLMPRWHGYPIRQRLQDSLGVPVLVDNDVNAMAWGEHWLHWRDVNHLAFIKVGYGIGLGMVSHGQVQRGEDGAAGDIGHMPVTAAEGIVCHCGNVGCLEAIASGSAMVRRLDEMGIEASGSREIVALAESGDRVVANMIRDSGRIIGEALVNVVNLINPRVIVVGGDIAHADHLLLAGIREEVYRRSLPLATRHLRIVRSRLDDHAGVVGAALTAIEHVLAPDAVDVLLSGGALRASSS